ncbi:MAG: HAMP domain-containing histidine kinase [Lachnospiraceae bacterium]|nr:HAMP domain-containing histidine kinase [Lachnospiraceae bacterium]
MLEEATRGDFSEKEFSEAKISRLESKLADYLQSSSLSAANVKKDRDKIKTLISDISHQTKTPIANLLLHSELLKESELNEEQIESLGAIENEAEKLRFLVDALVKLSRLENGIMVLEPKPENLSRLVREIGSAMRPKAEGKGLYLHVSDGNETALFDYKWTLEAVSNIVDNAVKYTEKGGIEISFKPTPMFACISVKDTGIGIAEEDIPKIFSRFGRLQSSREKEGVGIGLYLAREIITKESGYIKVKSRPGEGTEFLVYLKK